MKSISLNQSTKGEFIKAVQEDKPSLFLCYAEWCGHCSRFKPTWEKIKKSLASNKDVNVVEVEYTHMELLPKPLQNIRGFPTIQVLKKGKVSREYQGDRDHDSIVKFTMDQVKKDTKSVKPTIPSKRSQGTAAK